MLLGIGLEREEIERKGSSRSMRMGWRKVWKEGIGTRRDDLVLTGCEGRHEDAARRGTRESTA